MTVLVAQISMAAWLSILLLTLAWIALFARPVSLRFTTQQVRKIALFSAGGALGEILTLAAGGFWS